MGRTRQLWNRVTRGEPGTVLSFVLLIVGIVLGAVGVLAAIGIGLTARTAAQALGLLIPALLGGAAGWGAIVGFVQPHQALIWGSGFALPFLAWGLGCLPFALFEGPSLALWLVMALIIAACSMAAALLGGRFRLWLKAK